MMRGHVGFRPGKNGGSWFYKLHAGRDAVTGKKKYVGNGSYPTEKAAEADMKVHINALMVERSVAYLGSILPDVLRIMPTAAPEEPVEKIKVEAYLREWRTEHLPFKDIEETTRIQYDYTIETDLIPYFGHINLQDLRRRHLKDWVRAMQKPWYSKHVEMLAPRTIHAKFRCLSVALNDAVENEIISFSTASGVRLPRIESEDKKPLTPEQAQMILDAMLGKWYYVPTYLAFRTGARIGEIMALRGDRIDFEAGTLVIKRGVKHVNRKGLVEGSTKTKSSVRIIKVDTDTLGVLKNLIFQQEEDYASQGKKWSRNEYLFPSPKKKGLPYTPGHLSNIFRKVVRSFNLGGISFHDTRHAHASIMYDACHDLIVIQKRLGHAKLSTTTNTYLHLLEGVGEEAVVRFKSVMNGEPMTDAAD
jgi:integrase